LTQEKKTTISIREFVPGLKGFFEAFERIQKLSNWMTTVTLAVLAFLLTALFQIKSTTLLPYKYIAIIALVLLTISALFGFYFRLRSELSKFGSELHKGSQAISDIMQKASNDFDLDEQFNKAIEQAIPVIQEVFGEIRKQTVNYNFVWPITTQGISMGLGLVFSAVYIGMYLFAKR
jgi:hypothetical protein